VKRIITAVLAGIAALLVVTACGSSSHSTTAPKATATAKPSPSVPQPTVAAPTVLTAGAIAKAMKLHGVTVYTAATDPNQMIGRQGGYLSKAAWGDNDNSSIEVFATKGEAIERATYLSNFKPPFGDGYDWINEGALLRLDASYTPAQAKALQATFDQVMSG
jgi:hypothetical protein